MATYDEATEWLDENFPFFLTLVLNLGQPQYCSNIPTMQIVEDNTAIDGFVLQISPDFIEKLTPAEAAGVLGHEALHAILGHLGEASEGYFKDSWSLMASQEMICNDRLVDAGFVLPEGNPFYGDAMIGQSTVPYSTFDVYDLVTEKLNNTHDDDNASFNENSEHISNTSDSDSGSSADSDSDDSKGISDTSKETNNTKNQNIAPIKDASENSDEKPASINKNDLKNLRDQHDMCETLQNITGSLAQAVKDSFDRLADDIRDAMQNDPNSSLARGVDQLTEEMKEDLKLNDYTYAAKSNLAGTERTETLQEAAIRLDTNIEWIKILEKVNPDILQKKGKRSSRTRSSWKAPRRNIAHMYPHVMVPTSVAMGEPNKKNKNGTNKPLVVLALDLSSSIPRELQSVLVGLANKVPLDLMEVECCTFSTQAIPFDPRKTKNRLASGGTSFTCVEQFAREAANKHHLEYPKSIICITDGQASFGSVRRPKNLEAWTWLKVDNTKRVDVAGIKPENVMLLQEFLKNK